MSQYKKPERNRFKTNYQRLQTSPVRSGTDKYTVRILGGGEGFEVTKLEVVARGTEGRGTALLAHIDANTTEFAVTNHVVTIETPTERVAGCKLASVGLNDGTILLRFETGYGENTRPCTWCEEPTTSELCDECEEKADD